jgi:hypothetical protein
MGRSEAHEPREDRNVASWARQVVSCQRPTTPNRKEVQPRGPRPDRAGPRAGGGLIGHHLEPVPEAVTQFSASTPAVVAVDPGGTLMVRTHDPTAILSGRKAGMWTRRTCSRPAAATASPSRSKCEAPSRARRWQCTSTGQRLTPSICQRRYGPSRPERWL